MTDPKKKKGFLNKLSGAAGATSMHGIANIIESKSKFKKILWATFLTVALVGSTWYIATRLIDYMNWDTSTTFRKLYTQDRELDFPVVTICNYNKFFYNQKAIERKLTKELTKMADDLGLSDSELDGLFDKIWLAVDNSWMDEVIDSDTGLLVKEIEIIEKQNRIF